METIIILLLQGLGLYSVLSLVFCSITSVINHIHPNLVKDSSGNAVVVLLKISYLKGVLPVIQLVSDIVHMQLWIMILRIFLIGIMGGISAWYLAEVLGMRGVAWIPICMFWASTGVVLFTKRGWVTNENGGKADE